MYLTLLFGRDTKYLIDLAAERLLVAERGMEQIAVEIKSFTTNSRIHEFHSALGQYLSYQTALHVRLPTYRLYLAIPEDVYEDFLTRDIVKLILEQHHVNILAYNTIKEVITYEKSY